MDWLTHDVPVSVNPYLHNKDEPESEYAYSHGFYNHDVTAPQLLEAVTLGNAFSGQFEGSRSAKNFRKSGVLCLDFDSGVTKEVILEKPLIRETATLIYTTCRHTPAHHRFRVVIFLEEPIESAGDFRLLNRFLAQRFGADPRATDAARLFRGNTAAEAQIFDRGLGRALATDLIVEARASQEAVESTPGNGRPTSSSSILLKPDDTFRVPGRGALPLQELSKDTSIHCPVHQPDIHPSAKVVVSLRGTRGVYCFTCGKLYWPGREPFDFYTFEKALYHTRNVAKQGRTSGNGFDEALFPSEFDMAAMGRAQIQVVSERIVSQLNVKRGLTLIKSYKGSGKTTYLERLLSDQTKSVLLVGHRKTLLRSLSERLSLSCYLDEGADQRRISVCLDSILKIKAKKPYDYLIMDESEQVLSHVMGDTMEGRRRTAVLLLQHLVGKAKHVIALDADIGWPTFRFLTTSRKKSKSSTHVYLNERLPEPSTIRLVASRNQLVGELLEAVGAGRRCFVTANSKSLVEALHDRIHNQFPAKNTFAISSENSRTAVALNFVKNVKEQSRHFDVILTTPTLSTGVDISFPNDEKVFDEVFGFFEPNVTTHFECDQQIARVRHPGRVSVYVAPAKLNYETDLEVVSNDLKLGSLMEELIVGFNADCTPFYKEHDVLLELAGSVESLRRASLNDLRGNFIAHKEQQGTEIIYVETDEKLVAKGAGVAAEGAAASKESRFVRLLSAKRLTEDEFNEACQIVNSNRPLDEGLKWQIARTELEVFYCQPISHDLIERDGKGQLMEQVRLFEEFVRPHIIGLSKTMLKGEDPSDLQSFEHRRLARLVFLQEALKAAGLWNGESIEEGIEFCTYNLAGFAKFMISHKARYETHFNHPLRNDLKEKPAAQLRTLLGCLGLSIKEARRTTKNGKKTYYYKIDPDRLKDMNDVVSRRKNDAWETLGAGEETTGEDNCVAVY